MSDNESIQKSKKWSRKALVPFLAFVLLLLCDVSPLKAQNINAFNGTYSGTATKILMDGSAKTPQRMTFVLRNGVLTSNVPKIGKMPGRIYLNINSIHLAANGRISTSSGNAGKIKMFGLFSSSLIWDNSTGDRNGHFYGTLHRAANGTETLTLTLHVYASMMGKKVKATIVFNGSK